MCPELKQLEVTVIEETCGVVVDLVGGMMKSQTGDGRAMRMIKYLHPPGSLHNEELRTREMWNKHWERVGLEKYPELYTSGGDCD